MADQSPHRFVGVNTFQLPQRDAPLSDETIEWITERFSAVELSAVLPEQASLRRIHAYQLAHLRTSYHGPLSSEAVVDILTGGFSEFTPASPLVGHADLVLEHTHLWRALSQGLLIENIGLYRDPGHRMLIKAFKALPEARLCLDLSHEAHLLTASHPDAASAEFWRRVETVLEIADGRVGQIHMGCIPPSFPPDPVWDEQRYLDLANTLGPHRPVVPAAATLSLRFGVPVIIEGAHPVGNIEQIRSELLNQLAHQAA